MFVVCSFVDCIFFILDFHAVLGVFLEPDRFLLVFDLLAQLGVGLDHLDREVEDGLLGIATCLAFFFSVIALGLFLVLFS